VGDVIRTPNCNGDAGGGRAFPDARGVVEQLLGFAGETKPGSLSERALSMTASCTKRSCLNFSKQLKSASNADSPKFFATMAALSIMCSAESSSEAAP
jgi:hypothetical protein